MTKQQVHYAAVQLSMAFDGHPTAIWRAVAEMIDQSDGQGTMENRIEIMRVANCALSLQVAYLRETLREFGIDEEWEQESEAAIDAALKMQLKDGN